MKDLYGLILTDNKAIELDRLFTYKIPDKLLKEAEVGKRVLIPFGKGDRLIKGLILDIVSSYDGRYELKDISEVLDEEAIISQDLINLAKWIKKNYISSLIKAMQLVLPPGDYKQVIQRVILIEEGYVGENLDEAILIEYLEKNNSVDFEQLKLDLQLNNINAIIKKLKNNKIIKIKVDIKTTQVSKKARIISLNEDFSKISNDEVDKLLKNAPKQKEIIYILKDKEKMILSDLLKKANTTSSTVSALQDKGYIIINEVVVQRDAIKRKIEDYDKIELNFEQDEVFNSIINSYKSKEEDKFLIHGVTGSGKTEIYLQLVEYMITQGKQSIILVPEIALTPQTIDRFVGRFGSEVAILHSKLSDGERFDQWRKIKNSEVKIVIGARSAIFAPLDNLGLVIIDEEHEDTYKSSQNPKYDTIEVAEKRIEMFGGLIVLGSATPSIKSYYNAISRKKYKLLELTKRVNNIEMPKIEVVDMRMELEMGNKSMFSELLYNNITEALENKKQVILFLNRRGFSTFVSCRNCGHVVECENCDISMTYHRNVNILRCHYCGETKPIPKVCPVCGSKYIKFFGVGTQQVEEMTKMHFKNARVARLDADTTQAKDSYEKVLNKMKNKEIDILIGTQMISKGLDFEDVDLVGIIAADTSLNIPNYNSSEKTFQLITQVAGRAGRKNGHGKVILQTYDPEHYSLIYAKDHDFKGFYNDEILIRDMQLYPPHINLVNIMIQGSTLEDVISQSDKIYSILGSSIYHYYKEEYSKYLIGPSPALLGRIKNNYRYQIIMKIENKYLDEIRDLLERMTIENSFNLDYKKIALNVEINPTNII